MTDHRCRDCGRPIDKLEHESYGLCWKDRRAMYREKGIDVSPYENWTSGKADR